MNCRIRNGKASIMRKPVTMECPKCGLDLGSFDRTVDAVLHYDDCNPSAPQPRTFADIAEDIVTDLKAQGKPCPVHAYPYLRNLLLLNTTDPRQRYELPWGMEDGASATVYFLSNAGGYRGETAKLLKAELRKLAGLRPTK